VDKLQILEGVRVGEPAAKLLDDVDRDVDGERRQLLRAAVPDRVQVAPVHVIHRQEDPIAVQAGVEHGHQVAVRQPQRHHRLVAEPARVLGRDDLGRHLLDDAQLLEAGRAGQRQIELPHPAARQGPQQHVGIEPPRKRARAHLELRIPRRVRHGRAFYATRKRRDKLR